MIVREHRDQYLLINQHDHALVSGEFARHWAKEIPHHEPVLYAISYHDVGWRELDDEVRWNPETERPYSFMDYPLETKLQAYKNGLDLVESESLYAAYLCSMHYGSFVKDSEEPAGVRFKEGEEWRRAGISGGLSEEELEDAEYNFRLLQLCDDLSLFVCLNEPGENTFPWYQNGFGFMGERLVPIWRDQHTLSLEPNPFSGPFHITMPYRLISGSGRIVESGSIDLRVNP